MSLHRRNEELEKHKVTVDGRSFSVNLQWVVCDAPARSFVKKCVGHGAFFGCERCVQRGEKIGGSMTFQATDSDLRNDMSFRHQRNKKHHQGTSPFTELNIDMIKGNYYVIYHYIGNRNMNILCNIDINSSTDK